MNYNEFFAVFCSGFLLFCYRSLCWWKKTFASFANPRFRCQTVISCGHHVSCIWWARDDKIGKKSLALQSSSPIAEKILLLRYWENKTFCGENKDFCEINLFLIIYARAQNNTLVRRGRWLTGDRQRSCESKEKFEIMMKWNWLLTNFYQTLNSEKKNPLT